MSAKKTVSFGSVVGFIDVRDGIRLAELTDVKNHYALGDCSYVRTSHIVRVERDDDGNVTEIETKNTIYTKEEPSPVDSGAPEEN